MSIRSLTVVAVALVASVSCASSEGDSAVLVQRDVGASRTLAEISIDTNEISDIVSWDGEGWPAISPDGTRVAFVDERAGQSEIFLVGRDGSGLEQLTDRSLPGVPWELVWTQDSSSLLVSGVFDSPSENFDIWLVNVADGTASPVVSDLSDNFCPSVRRGGDDLLFTSDRSGTYQLYTARMDGSSVRPLTSGDDEYVCGAYSPDGATIAATVNDTAIVLMDIDGSNERFLATGPGDSTDPIWSPDGKRIAFSNERDGERSAFIATLDGDVVRLTSGTETFEYVFGWR